MKKGKQLLLFSLMALSIPCLNSCNGSKHEHNVLSWTTDSDASCAVAGEKHGECSECGEVVTAAIPALGHDISTELSHDHNGHWHACKRAGCDFQSDFEEHTESGWLEDVDSEGKKTGAIHVECTECGEFFKSDYAQSAALWAEKDGEPVVKMSLAEFKNNVNTGTTYEGYTITLKTNIDMMDNSGDEPTETVWTEGIGSAAHPFKGVFNGGYKKISNLKIENADAENFGLFSYTENVTIKDLTLDNISVKGKKSVGGLVGYNAGSFLFDGISVLSNCSVDGSGSKVGGILGCDESYSLEGELSMKFKGVIFYGNVIGDQRVGGLAGGIAQNAKTQLTFENCLSQGKLEARTNYVSDFLGHRYQGAQWNCLYTAVTTFDRCTAKSELKGKNQAHFVAYWAQGNVVRLLNSKIGTNVVSENNFEVIGDCFARFEDVPLLALGESLYYLNASAKYEKSIITSEVNGETVETVEGVIDELGADDYFYPLLINGQFWANTPAADKKWHKALDLEVAYEDNKLLLKAGAYVHVDNTNIASAGFGSGDFFRLNPNPFVAEGYKVQVAIDGYGNFVLGGGTQNVKTFRYYRVVSESTASSETATNKDNTSYTFVDLDENTITSNWWVFDPTQYVDLDTYQVTSEVLDGVTYYNVSAKSA